MSTIIGSPLAIDGGKPAVSEPIARFNTISVLEADAAFTATFRGPLSGYLGGQLHGGYYVEALERKWEEIFHVKHAVSCNSATSGLLMACEALELKTKIITVTPFTMSATAAVPVYCGNGLIFKDIDPETFCTPGAVLATNIFGHPAPISGDTLIEDNAQAILAKEGEKYAGTRTKIGVWSLNVHKHLQCGEGGIVTTNVDDLADKLRLFRNHGELARGHVGLNLRMTEVSAAIALVQLKRARKIVSERIEIAEAIIEAIGDIPHIKTPIVRDNCTHSYYCIAIKTTLDRKRLVEALNAEGVPVKEGYVDPLYRLPAFRRFKSECRVAERMHDTNIFLYENCSYSPTSKQIRQIGTAFRKAADVVASVGQPRANETV